MVVKSPLGSKLRACLRRDVGCEEVRERRGGGRGLSEVVVWEDCGVTPLGPSGVKDEGPSRKPNTDVVPQVGGHLGSGRRPPGPPRRPPNEPLAF